MPARPACRRRRDAGRDLLRQRHQHVGQDVGEHDVERPVHLVDRRRRDADAIEDQVALARSHVRPRPRRRRGRRPMPLASAKRLAQAIGEHARAAADVEEALAARRTPRSPAGTAASTDGRRCRRRARDPCRAPPRPASAAYFSHDGTMTKRPTLRGAKYCFHTSRHSSSSRTRLGVGRRRQPGRRRRARERRARRRPAARPPASAPTASGALWKVVWSRSSTPLAPISTNVAIHSSARSGVTDERDLDVTGL